MAQEFLRQGDVLLPRGILPVWADIGAGLVAARLAQEDGPNPRASAQMIGVDLISGAVIRTDVIGVDGCEVCDASAPAPLDRSIVGMQAILRPTLSGVEHEAD